MQKTILRTKQVAEKLGISVSAVWYKVNPENRRYDATFPKPFKVSDNITGWLESEINAYIDQLANQRSDTPKIITKTFDNFEAACAYVDELTTSNDVDLTIHTTADGWQVKQKISSEDTPND